jgi:hypothetical protein
MTPSTQKSITPFDPTTRCCGEKSSLLFYNIGDKADWVELSFLAQ